MAAMLCIKGIVYHEARGEPSIGQAAVVAVVLNRAKQSGEGVCATIRKPGQFTGRKTLHFPKDFNISYQSLDELPADIKQATYFKNYPGKWGNHKYIGRIGRHYFYKD